MIFVSHAEEDRTKAEAIVAYLEANDLQCWIAPRNVRSGAEYPVEIAAAIRAADAVVLVLSGASNASPFVKREIERAVSQDKAVHAVRVEDVTPEGSLELLLATRHWIDALAAPIEHHLAALVDSLRGSVPYRQPGRTVGRRRPWLRWSMVGIVVLAAGLGISGYLWSLRRASDVSTPEAAALSFLTLVESSEFAEALRLIAPSSRALAPTDVIRGQLSQLQELLKYGRTDEVVFSSLTATVPTDNRPGVGHAIRVQRAIGGTYACVDVWLRQEASEEWSIESFEWPRPRSTPCIGSAGVDSAVILAGEFLDAVRRDDRTAARALLAAEVTTSASEDTINLWFSSLRGLDDAPGQANRRLVLAVPMSRFGQPARAGDFVNVWFDATGSRGAFNEQVVLMRQFDGSWRVVLFIGAPHP